MQTIDNDLYDHYGRLWWEDEGCGAMATIRFVVNPLRSAFFRQVADRLLGSSLRKCSLLDVGSGGGFLAEDLCKAGLDVTGIDISYASTVAAKLHADQELGKGRIAYVRGVGQQLPFKKASFNLAACCDMLEHVPDPSVVVGEISRVLKPGGIFFYETINRTFSSWIMTIEAMQEWKSTSFVPKRTHKWEMFIKPEELFRIMAKHGLENEEIRGLSPGVNVIASYLSLRRRARGEIGYRELARRLRFHSGNNTSSVYIGYGIKRNC